MKDRYGRHINYLRLAVTDRCNLRCHYCMPEEGIKYIPKVELLTYEEMLRLVQVLSAEGVDKLRLTGGEPFVRKDLIGFLKEVRSNTAIQSLNMTTNGTLCKAHLEDIKDLNFNSINLSLDTLDEGRFFEITRREGLADVLYSMDAFLQMPLKLKVNMVVMSDVNTEDLIPMALLAKDKDLSVRFIEEMPFNGGTHRPSGQSLSYRDIILRLQAHFGDLELIPSAHGATAMEYRVKGFKGTLGVIPAYSRTFCGSCNRLRITAQGLLKTCLYDKGIFDLKAILRNGATDSMLRDTIIQAVQHKAKNGFEAEKERFDSTIMESMSTIGG